MTVTASPAFASQMRWKYGAICGGTDPIDVERKWLDRIHSFPSQYCFTDDRIDRFDKCATGLTALTDLTVPMAGS